MTKTHKIGHDMPRSSCHQRVVRERARYRREPLTKKPRNRSRARTGLSHTPLPPPPREKADSELLYVCLGLSPNGTEPGGEDGRDPPLRRGPPPPLPGREPPLTTRLGGSCPKCVDAPTGVVRHKAPARPGRQDKARVRTARPSPGRLPRLHPSIVDRVHIGQRRSPVSPSSRWTAGAIVKTPSHSLSGQSA